MKWLQACFKFFGSLKLAIFLLVVLGIIFGVGTFVESYHGTHAAQVLVYRTRWLSFLLVLLALNLFASAVDRIPWQRKHLGFLTTHSGIILMLAGSLVTQAFGIDGQMQIEEGTAEGRITLSEGIIQIVSIDSGKRWTLPFQQHVFPWTGREEIGTELEKPFDLSLLTDYGRAKPLPQIQTKN